jgi:hypothetical protein
MDGIKMAEKLRIQENKEKQEPEETASTAGRLGPASAHPRIAKKNTSDLTRSTSTRMQR